MTISEEMISKYYDVVDDETNTENEIQKFLEENTVLIPTPFLLNHGLHMQCIISKFPLSYAYRTDFAYLTKSTDFWYFVMVELEDPKKKLFTNQKENVYFSSEFNHAYDQITSWKAFAGKHKDIILDKIDKLRVPLNDNSVEFKYVLIIGKNGEKEHNAQRREMLAEKNTADVRVMTYDSIISAYKAKTYHTERIVLSTWKNQGFKVKRVPIGTISTSLFAYMSCEYLNVPSGIINRLKDQDYDMDSWGEGEPLIYNDKYTADRLKDFMKI